VTIVPISEWYDLWHAHPNDEGLGQRWSNLLKSWVRVDAAGHATGQPWQSWLVIEQDAPREDAVYLHTPNPNQDNFPYTFEDVEWGVVPPDWADPAEGLEFGRSGYGGVELVWVRRLHDTEPSSATEPTGI